MSDIFNADNLSTGFWYMVYAFIGGLIINLLFFIAMLLRPELMDPTKVRLMFGIYAVVIVLGMMVSGYAVKKAYKKTQ